MDVPEAPVSCRLRFDAADATRGFAMKPTLGPSAPRVTLAEPTLVSLADLYVISFAELAAVLSAGP